MSRQTPQAAPSRKLSAAPARAISRAASSGSSYRGPGDQGRARDQERAPCRSRTGRPASRTPGSRRSVVRPPTRSATALRISGRPASSPSCVEVEPARLFQVGRQPGDVEVEAVGLGEVHQAERDHVPVGEDPCRTRRVEPVRALDRTPAASISASARSRLTAGWSAGSSRNQRNQATAQTNPIDAEDDEDHPPGHELQQGRDQERRQPAAQMGPGEEDALGRAALGERETSARRSSRRSGNAPASPIPKRNRTASSEA